VLEKGASLNFSNVTLEKVLISIQRQTFFDFQPDPIKKYAVIGNPPCGRVCSLAVKFFNKAAEFSEVKQQTNLYNVMTKLAVPATKIYLGVPLFA
jgi:hypothetical protein